MSGLFDGLTRGVPGIGPRDMEPPEASFYSEAEIAGAASLQYSADKFFAGVIGAQIIEQRDKKDRLLYRYAQGGTLIGIEDDRHIITVAGSRAGKGRSAIIPNMLRYKGSVLAIDPKGELALATAKRRAKFQQVMVIDPFDTTEHKLPENFYAGFNPLEHMSGTAAIEDTILITDALVIPEGRDPHWDESARSFIEGVILDVLTAERFDGRRNLATVRDLIIEGDELEDAETGLEALRAYMEASAQAFVRRAAADFFERPDRERDSVLSTARRHLRTLNFPEIEDSLRGSGPPLSALKSGAMTIYLCLPGRHIGTCGRWLRLFVNLALEAMEKTPGPPAAGAPVLFVLDEFAALGHMKEIEDAAGQIAGFGVKLWPILQDLGQLKALYKDRWETFMGNAGILQFFGNNDLTTLEWISKRLGSTTIEQLSKSEVTPNAREAGAWGESYSPRTTPVLEPDEVALIFGRDDVQLRQLIIRAGYDPMILQRAFWDKHEGFAR